MSKARAWTFPTACTHGVPFESACAACRRMEAGAPRLLDSLLGEELPGPFWCPDCGAWWTGSLHSCIEGQRRARAARATPGEEVFG